MAKYQDEPGGKSVEIKIAMLGVFTVPARRSGHAHAVLGWMFRAGRKNSCDAVVAEFFAGAFETATATRSTPKPGHIAQSPRPAFSF